MTLNIRILDLTNLNLSLEIPDKTTVSQLTKILSEKHNINTNKCTFAANGNQLELDTTLDESVLSPSFAITIVDDLLYPMKSFPIVENSYPNQKSKFGDIFQNQPEYRGKKGQSRGQGKKTNGILTRIIEILFSGNRGAEDIISHFRDGLYGNAENDDEYEDYGDSYDGDYESDDDDSGGDDDYDDEDENIHDINIIDFPDENIIFSHNDDLMNENFDERTIFGRLNLRGIGAFMADRLLPPELLGMNDLPPEVQGLEQTLTQEQRDAVTRMCEQTGIDRPTVLQIYEACDHNEDVATNCLMSFE